MSTENDFDPQNIPSRFDFLDAQERITKMWDQGEYFHAKVDPCLLYTSPSPRD